LPDGAATMPWRRFLLEGVAFGAFGPCQLVVAMWFLCCDRGLTEWWSSPRGVLVISSFGCPAISCNSSSRVSILSSDGTTPSNLGERARALFGEGWVVPSFSFLCVCSR
jgi:hypothetical protein